MSKQIMLSKTQQSIVAALDGALYVKDFHLLSV
jgi:hypothetical protein